jgi:FMN reductase (NADPH)
MENRTIQELFSRKSVRVFSDEKIIEEEKRLILEAAIQAPTAGNMSLFSILDIQSQEIKNILAKRCDDQNFIAEAPIVLVFLADYQRWYDVLESYEMTIPPMGEGDLFLAMQDCMIAAQNAVVAAESMGIGSCYIGDILENYEDNQKLLNLPKYVLPISMLVLGRPTKQQKNRTKPERFKVEDLVFTDAYPDKDTKETRESFKRKLSVNDEELKERLERYKKRKFEAEFRMEMNRSSKAMIENWKKL